VVVRVRVIPIKTLVVLAAVVLAGLSVGAQAVRERLVQLIPAVAAVAVLVTLQMERVVRAALVLLFLNGSRVAHSTPI
jgi:hypothetical protein|tara:strand:- start:768 stop:1001 length:234 start_codon:yes stop_codon:yes gene_type:complete